MKPKPAANVAYKNSMMEIADMNVYELLAWGALVAAIVFIVAVVAGCLKVLSDLKFDEDDNRDDDCGV